MDENLDEKSDIFLAAPDAGPQIVTYRYYGCETPPCADAIVYWQVMEERFI